MASTAERPARGPRITVQLDRAHLEFLKTHRRQYGLASSWIIRRLIENQMASGRDLLGKPLATGRPRRVRRRATLEAASEPATMPGAAAQGT
jgi:hypothetical protein